MLCVFAFGIAGYYPVFRIMQLGIQEEMELRIAASIPTEQLHAIAVGSSEEVDWQRAGKEFKFRNDLYDVVRSESRGDSTVYYCVKDSEEEKLFDGFEELAKKEMNRKGEQEAGKDLLKIFFNLYAESSPAAVVSEEHMPAFFHYSTSFSAPARELSTPPPEHC